MPQHLAWSALGAMISLAQAQSPAGYVPVEDPLVRVKLERFQDWKFGLMLHWGTYSQWGIVESWSLCPEDEGWCERKGPFADDYAAYVKAYEGLKTSFYPVKFDPVRWAAAAHDAGMRYVVFTTKHHDGFCMFDTKETDYKATDAGCAFSAHPKANIAKELFGAFRERGLGIGAYFSKPDWHSDDYWWRRFPPFDRNVNYDITKYPERWESFKRFTSNQIRELMTEYGSIDILWLDGGWVQPMTATSPRWGKVPTHQDIDMPTIAAMARSHQPGLIIVDRAVEGPYQNYITPEHQVPDSALGVPWETCMPMATSWSYVPSDIYRPSRTLVHLLVDIVAKGGNFLLNVGPGPDGTLDDTAYARLRDLGDWMKVNGGAIYGTRTIPPYKDGQVAYTRGVNGVVNAIYLAREDESSPPESITIPSFIPANGSEVRMLGVQEPLRWEKRGKGCVVQVPEVARRHPPSRWAWVVQFRP
ncbi:MAG: alpha-L-fucosidase [Bacteroidetes bacterium]|nr:alpha-L-fucosidase [Bacteroidota bacterium]